MSKFTITIEISNLTAATALADALQLYVDMEGDRLGDTRPNKSNPTERHEWDRDRAKVTAARDLLATVRPS